MSNITSCPKLEVVPLFCKIVSLKDLYSQNNLFLQFFFLIFVIFITKYHIEVIDYIRLIHTSFRKEFCLYRIKLVNQNNLFRRILVEEVQ